MTRILRTSLSITLGAVLCGAMVTPVHADRKKARSSVNRSVDVDRNRSVDIDRNRSVDIDRNRSVDIDRNRSLDVDIDRDRDIDIDRDIAIDIDRRGCCYSGWGTAAAVATTAVVTSAVVGSRTYALPPNCTLMVVNGLTYQQCGTVYYQPQFVGTTPSYIVVNAPR